MSYTHLSRDERYQIQCLQELGQSAVDIARQLQRHPSTIRRELTRNAKAGTYCADAAHAQASARQSRRCNARRFEPHEWALVMTYLQFDLSPQQAAARLSLEQRLHISHSGIYRRLHQLGLHRPHLRCGRRRRKAREGVGQLPDRVGIEQRPAIVDERSRLGDWEGDTIVSGQGALGAIVTLAERRSRYTLAAPLKRRLAEATGEAIIELLRPHRSICHTLTLDNGKEFTQHARLARHLGVTETEVLDAVHRLNHRPRRCLGWKTPHDVFHGFEMTPLTLQDWRTS